jgi:hypothetical protein
MQLHRFLEIAQGILFVFDGSIARQALQNSRTHQQGPRMFRLSVKQYIETYQSVRVPEAAHERLCHAFENGHGLRVIGPCAGSQQAFDFGKVP